MSNKGKLFTGVIIYLIFMNSISAQEIDINKKISIVVKNKSLKTALKEISKKGNIHFSYSNQQINDKQKISIVARQQSIESVFVKLFSKLSIDFLIVEKQVILKSKPKNKEEQIKIKLEKFTISGYMKDSESDEILIGATVIIDGKPIGTVSNAYGFYSLTLPAGNYLLKYSYIGYKSKTISIKLNKNLKISQKLALDETNLDVIIITEKENADILEINPLQTLSLSNETIKKTHNIGGETSLVKSLNSIPGINPYGDGSVMFYVRGGNKDQNLIIVDEAPIYNPSHMLGFFSSIAPEAIKSINVSKGNFPVQYGGRLSSIIDVKTKDGNMKYFSFNGSFSPFTGSLTLEGPIIKEKASYVVTLRTSTLNWFFEQQPGELNMEFQDFHTKLNFKFNRNNRIFFSFYSGNDLVEAFTTAYNTFAMSWQNFAATIRWNHLFSERFFSNLTLYTSNYNYYLYSSIEDNQYWHSSIGNLSLKNDFSYYINPKNTLRFGIELNTHNFNPGNQNNNYYEEVVASSSALQAIVYIGDKIKFLDKLSLNLSFRGLNWNNIGPTIIYNFNNNYLFTDSIHIKNEIYHSYFNAEPQIELLYAINKSTLFKLSYNHHIQYLNLLSNSVSPFTTLDVWMPAGPNIKPQKSNQFIVGFHKKNTEFIFTTEAFYKKMYNQIDYANHANMLLNPLIEGELRIGNAFSYGIELFLKKQTRNLTGWLGYSYIRTFRNIKDVNNNKVYPVAYDKPHYITLNLSYKWRKRWNLNLNWVYSSGIRFSSPTGFYNVQNHNIPIYSEKNNSKLPDYHRMDASISFRLNKNERSKYKHHLSFAIYNLYAKENPISVNFSKIETEQGDFVIPSNYITDNQIVPTTIHLFGIVPSITYKFKFR